VAGTRIAGQVCGIPIAAVALASAMCIFGRGEMGVVDEQIGVPGESQGRVPMFLLQILDIGEVGHNGIAVLQAIAQTGGIRSVIDAAGSELDWADLETLFADFADFDVGAYCAAERIGHRTVYGVHLIVEQGSQRASPAATAVEGKAVTRDDQGREERNPLYVIPVGMSEQEVGQTATPGEIAAEEGVSQPVEPGAAIQDQGLTAIDVHGHAGGIAAQRRERTSREWRRWDGSSGAP